MKVRETLIQMCATCGEIALDGYTDSIDSTEDHLKQVNDVEAILNENEYFSSDAITLDCDEGIDRTCEVCDAVGTSYIVKALENVETDVVDNVELSIDMDSGNDSIVSDPSGEAVRMLEFVIDQIKNSGNGNAAGNLRDVNGNTVGTFSFSTTV